MSPALRLGLALCLVLALAAPRALAECARPHWVAHTLTTLSSTFPHTGGALVVALEAEPTGADQPDLAGIDVTRGRRISYPLAGVAIAPGLYRVPFDAHMTRGAWVLHGLGPDATLTVGAGAMPGAPVRPSVRHMRRVSAAGLGSTAVQRIEVRADLEFPVPEGILAAIVTWNTDAAPSAWNRVSQGQSEIVAYTTPSRCAATAPGWAAPPDGTLLARIAWVDRFGQISPASDATSVD